MMIPKYTRSYLRRDNNKDIDFNGLSDDSMFLEINSLLDSIAPKDEDGERIVDLSKVTELVEDLENYESVN